MPRFFLELERWGRVTSLTGGEAHHCARVMRAVPGDRIEVFDGEGRGAAAIVRSVSKQAVEIELGEESREPEPPVRVVLAVSVLKGKAMEWLIQKAVEIGVDEVFPVVAARCIARRDSGGWARTALEACKQCGRRRLPRLHPAVDLEGFLALEAPPGGRRLIASLGPGAVPLRERLGVERPSAEVTFLIGPEGDFTPQELAAAMAAGYQPVTLGHAVLRSETAAVFCLAVAACALG